MQQTQQDRDSHGDAESPMPRPYVLGRAAVAAVAFVCLIVGGVVSANALFQPVFEGASELVWPHSEISKIPVDGRWVIAVVALAYGVLLLVALGFSNRAVRVARVHTGPRALVLSREALTHAETRTEVSFDQAVVFWQALRYPRQRFTRITETAEYGSRTVRVSTTFTLAASDLGDGLYAIPLLQAARGSLLHGVRFTKGEQRISSLTHAESVVFVRKVIRRLVEAAGPEAIARFEGTIGVDHRSGTKWWQRGVRNRMKSPPPRAVPVPHLFELEELDGVVPPRRASPDTITIEDLVERLIRSAGPTPAPTARYVADRITSLNPAHPSLAAAADVVLALRRNYPICVPIVTAPDRSGPAADSHRITVERVVIPGRRPRGDSDRLRGSASHRVVGWLEAKREAIERALNQALGVPVTTLTFPLRLAESTDSYHLNLRGPEGHYVSEQEILRRHDLDDGGRVPRSELAALSYAMSPRQGQRTAHIYIRSGTKPGRYEYQARFAERMPGAMATTFVSAVTTLVISSAIALATLSLTATEQASSLGLLQILLAFPLALTATSNYTHGSPFWGGDLASRLATLITVVVLAASLWVSTAAMIVPKDTVATWWSVVLTTAALNTLFTLTAWLTRVSIHRSFTP